MIFGTELAAGLEGFVLEGGARAQLALLGSDNQELAGFAARSVAVLASNGALRFGGDADGARDARLVDSLGSVRALFALLARAGLHEVLAVGALVAALFFGSRLGRQRRLAHSARVAAERARVRLEEAVAAVLALARLQVEVSASFARG